MKFERQHNEKMEVKFQELPIGAYFTWSGEKDFGCKLNIREFFCLNVGMIVDIDQDAMVIPVEITEVKYKI